MKRKILLRLISLILPALILFLANSASASLIRNAELQIEKSDGTTLSKDPLNIRGATIGSLAIGDLGKDNLNEIVIGTGSGMDPLVAVLRADGTKIFRFFAFPKKFRSGVNAVLGDLDGDNINEIIAAPNFGGTPTIRIFNNLGVAKTKGANKVIIKKEFDAFDKTHLNGLSLATLDFDGDGRAEIAASEGPGGDGEVRIFKADGTNLAIFKPFSDEIGVHGINLAVSGSNIICAEASKGSHVAVFDKNDLMKAAKAWEAFGSDFDGGIRVSTGMEMQQPAIFISPVSGKNPSIKTFSLIGDSLREKKVFEEDFEGGVFAAQWITSTGEETFIVAPSSPIYLTSKSDKKYIEVDLKDQRLYGWENGYLVRTFLVSTGLKKTPTPIGDYKVLRKPLFVDYTLIYGPNDPRNYDYPNTRWNLMFRPHYYIHTAWWHNNFGRPMSHGCINTSALDAEWIYGWAPMSTEVKVIASLDEKASIATTIK
ncbi:MAG: L,D-transpeptidase family protein [bacterium]